MRKKERERERERPSKISFDVLVQYYFVNLSKNRAIRDTISVYMNEVSINWVKLHCECIHILYKILKIRL
ncbi:MAG: hypothetical protein ACI8RD_010468 [Bacillariaceae sp.]|jgi:hypothetical protein